VYILWTLCVLNALYAIGLTYVCHRLAQRAEQRQLRELKRSVELLELDASELYDRMQRQSAKLAGRAKRDAANGSGSETSQRPGESVAQWKARVRGLIREGKLHHEP